MSTNDRPIFIVGCARSGTTMLQLMLHAHPRIAIPPETRFLLDAYQRRGEFGDLKVEANRRALASWIVERKGTAFRDLGLDPQETMDEIVAGPATLGSALGIVFRAYARRFDKPRWGDKRPAYLANLDALLRLFPDAQIVHIVRDGRDCVASLKEASWHKGGVPSAVSGWNRGIDAGRRAARQLGSDSFHELYYESLVDDPERELRRLCAFLGEEYDPAMAAPNELASVAVPKRKKWHALTHSAPTSKRVGSWAHRLEPWEIGLCESVMGDRLVRHGYELVGGHSAGLANRMRYVPLGLRGRASRVKRSLTSTYYRWRPPTGLAALLTRSELAHTRPDRSTATEVE